LEGKSANIEHFQQHYLHKYNNTVKITDVVIYCDCKSLIDSINKWKHKQWTTKFHYSPDADLLRQIMEENKILQLLGIFVTFKHVRGHQDRLRRELTLPEQLNVAADHLATSALRIRHVPTITLPSLRVKMTMDDKQITASYTTIMREAYTSIDLRNHLKISNNWSDNIMETLWWKPLGSAMSDRPSGEHRTLVKFLHNRLPCNRKQNRYYGYISPNCHMCTQTEENQDHILRCTGCQSRQERRNKYLIELQKYLEESRTNIET
jgi:RNase H